jgi:hypothetical protein
MVECDVALNKCKQEKMKTDTTCSTPECAQCTSTYKACHDKAVQAGIQPVTIECAMDKDRKSLTMVGTNPNVFPEVCSVVCTFTTGDKQQKFVSRQSVQLPKQAMKAFLGDDLYRVPQKDDSFLDSQIRTSQIQALANDGGSPW